MLTPWRALTKTTRTAPLPEVATLRSLHAAGFKPRLGQVIMVVGQPGALKSMWAQWYADELDLPTLYFCADSDAHTALARLIAKRSGFKTDSVIAGMESGGLAYYEEWLADSKIQYCFDSGPTLQDMADELNAYVELWDAFPKLIIVDNLLNVEAETGEDFGGMRLVSREVHRMARETGAAVLILHHMREIGDPAVPQPRSDIQGKVAQIPEMILSIAHDATEGAMKIALVKNRGGWNDPTGKQFFRLAARPESASFGPWVGMNYHSQGQGQIIGYTGGEYIVS